MKKNNLRFTFLALFVSFFLIQVFSVSAITVTCLPCQLGNCNCNVNTCPSGSGFLTVYKTSDCSGVPVFKTAFTANAAIWSPDSFGAYYGRVLCDDRLTKSDCNRIDVLQTDTTSTSTSTETSTETTTETTTDTETTTTPPPSSGSNLGLWLGIIIVIIIVVLAIFLLTRKRKSKSSSKASYEDLYKKWSR
ncbi:MAG: hypothetical protein J4452_02690 [Candidatus Aenigmarchaeota archaeon]|nr:hypothetical protein [Candidatus Aenigmarchaeota archaeon]